MQFRFFECMIVLQVFKVPNDEIESILEKSDQNSRSESNFFGITSIILQIRSQLQFSQLQIDFC